MNPLDTTKRQVACSKASYVIVVCVVHATFHRFQSTVHQPSVLSRCSHGDVVMLFCSSFTQSERFLQTDQLIIRLHVKVVTNFIRVLMRNEFVNVFKSVFKSDALIWWAAIFRPSSMFDKLLHLSKSESFAMICSRRCNLREAVGNLLTVTMYLQDTLSRFHRPGLH